MSYDPGIIAAGIQATGQVVAGAAGAAGLFSSKTFAKEQFWRQAEFQKEMNAKQEAYQDKVNQQNFDWNRAKNVRARMEEAGYNPYLTGEYGQAGAMASGTTFGANASENAPVYANPIGDAIRIGGEGASSYANALSSLLASKEKQYDFNRKKSADLITDAATGQVAGADAKKTLADVNSAEALARQQIATASIEEMRQIVYSSQAYDANGVPMTDEATGQPLTMMMAQQRQEFKNQMKGFDKLCSDIEKNSEEVANLTWDTWLKKYDLEFLRPQELANLKQTYDNMKQQLKVMETEANLNRANTAKSYAEEQDLVAHQEVNKKYAALLGQQRLTEQQTTNLRELEVIFGGPQKLAEIAERMAPKSWAALASNGSLAITRALGINQSGKPIHQILDFGDKNIDGMINKLNKFYSGERAKVMAR